MGVRTVYTMGFLGFAAMLISICSCVWGPLYKVQFFVGAIIPVAQMETYVLSIRFPQGEDLFCGGLRRVIEAGRGSKNAKSRERSKLQAWCDTIVGYHDIQDVSMHFCTPLTTFLWPEFCTGLSSAFMGGMFLVISTAFNAIFQVTGIYLLHDYATRKPNPRYRQLGLLSLVLGGFVLLVAIIVYGFMVLQKLTSIGAGWTSLFFSTGQKDGTSFGFILLCSAVLLEIIQLCLFPWVEREFYEDMYIEEKLRKDDLREAGLPYQSTGNYMPPPAGAPVMGGSSMPYPPPPMMMGQQPSPTIMMAAGPPMGGPVMFQGPGQGYTTSPQPAW